MFDQLITEHGPRLFALCRHLWLKIEDAEDLYQETWLKAFKNYHRYDSARSFAAWLTQICVNTYRDQLRRYKLRRLWTAFTSVAEQELVLSRMPAPPDTTEDPDLRQAILELPEAERLCLVLFYFDDQEVKRIAQLTDTPEGTVKSRLHQARERLRRRLNGL